MSQSLKPLPELIKQNVVTGTVPRPTHLSYETLDLPIVSSREKPTGSSARKTNWNPGFDTDQMTDLGQDN